MLRITSHIIFSFLLLVTTIGIVISKHYCGGELVSASVFVEAESCCDSDNCCKNETESYRLDEDFSVSTITEVPESVQLELFAVALVVFEMNFETTEETRDFIIADLPPPPKIQTALSQRQTYLL